MFQEDSKDDAIRAFQNDVQNQTLNLNVEYRVGNVSYVTLVDTTNNEDIARNLILDGFLMLDNRKEKRLQKLVSRATRSYIGLHASVTALFHIILSPVQVTRNETFLHFCASI
jgi:hypothetical protein